LSVRAVLLRSAAAAVAIAVLVAGAAQAQEPGRLSPARFAAFDAVYAAFVALDHDATAAETADVRRACDALDRDDRLLAATRTACLATLKLSPARAGFAACETQPRGEAHSRRVRPGDRRFSRIEPGRRRRAAAGPLSQRADGQP